MKLSVHYLCLALAIALGAALRFWNLDFKPLWLDEVITGLFSMGRNYNDVPLEVVFPLSAVAEIFTFNPTATCPQIAHTLATQSTHPPLFFCLMHAWLEAFRTCRDVGCNVSTALKTDLRSLPALLGVGAIAAVYFLNRIAFSKTAGLMAAVVMAVSPFGVYLSQEARHYTLPMLLITLALLGLIQIQKDLQKQQFRPLVWLAWVAVNSIGFYIHYFFILAYIAQLASLIAYPIFSKKATINPQNITHYLLPITCSLLPFLFFIPWLPAVLADAGSSDTSWIPQPHNIAPLYQTLIAWILMVIALPAEHQPLWIAIPSGLLMVLFGIWLGRHIFQGLQQLWQTPSTHLATLTLGSFTLCLLLQFFAIVYLLGKDLTVAPRYNFVYYPAFCALLGAALVGRDRGDRKEKKSAWSATQTSLLLVGIISCIFVIYGGVFHKPFQPQKVARDMNLKPSMPLMMVVGYNDYQDVALGLSFALALEKERTQTTETYLGFYRRSPGYESVWQNLSQMPPLTASSLNLWVVAPGLRRRDYPPQLALSSQKICNLDPDQHHRIGIPYQLYECSNKADLVN